MLCQAVDYLLMYCTKFLTSCRVIKLDGVESAGRVKVVQLVVCPMIFIS